MRSMDEIFAKLKHSPFRSRFHLSTADRVYIDRKSLSTILEHASDFVNKRLGQTSPPNDGRQTPFRGHPVFVAQHATATCCRSCLDKWHKIPSGRELVEKEREHILAVLERWLTAELERPSFQRKPK